MSHELSWPLLPEDATSLVQAARVPAVLRSSHSFGLGHFEFREGVSKEGLESCVAVLGAFDGYHVGHAELMRKALESAKAQGTAVVAVTFWPDPSETLGSAQGRIMDARQRVDALLGAGASAVAVMRFDNSFAALSPEGFVQALLDVLRPSEIHVGENFRFGHGGQGTTQTLTELCAKQHVAVHVREILNVGGLPVSATRIRSLIAEGNLSQAQALMGRYLCLAGTVAHGRGEGTGFGFSTANIMVDKRRVVLQRGVYAGYAIYGGYAWPTAANAGAPASFGDGDVNLIEAHLLGFSGNIYGKDVSFVPLRLLRPERQFASREELIRTVQGNIDWVSHNLPTGALEVGA